MIKDFFSQFTKKNYHKKNNPYLNSGMRAFNDRYENLALSRQQWQMAAFVAMAITLLLGILLFKMIGKSSVEPFVVETNQGQPYAILTSNADNLNDPKLINYAVNQFIINARTIVSDTNAQKTLLDNVYAYSAGNTLTFLRNYYDAHNPYLIAKQNNVSVSIVTSMPISEKIWQITWDETTQGQDGMPPTITRWMANLQIAYGPVNPHFMTSNPFGLYVTQISWSPLQTRAL